MSAPQRHIAKYAIGFLAGVATTLLALVILLVVGSAWSAQNNRAEKLAAIEKDKRELKKEYADLTTRFPAWRAAIRRGDGDNQAAMTQVDGAIFGYDSNVEWVNRPGSPPYVESDPAVTSIIAEMARDRPNFASDVGLASEAANAAAEAAAGLGPTSTSASTASGAAGAKDF
jgi:hypothetical protein